MWSLNSHGALIWTEASKLLLLELIDKHPIVLSEFKDREKAQKSWQKIYIELTNRTMPPSSVAKVRGIWHRMRNAARKIAIHNKHSKKKIKPNIIQTVTMNLLQSRKEFLEVPLAKNVREVPIKRHIESDEMDSEAEGDDIPENVSTSSSDFCVSETSMALSTVTSQQTSAQSEYWAKMKKVAELELSLKKTQLENENERIALERAMHRRNLRLVDMRIRQQQILISNQKLRNTDANMKNGTKKG